MSAYFHDFSRLKIVVYTHLYFIQQFLFLIDFKDTLLDNIWYVGDCSVFNFETVFKLLTFHWIGLFNIKRSLARMKSLHIRRKYKLIICVTTKSKLLNISQASVCVHFHLFQWSFQRGKGWLKKLMKWSYAIAICMP